MSLRDKQFPHPIPTSLSLSLSPSLPEMDLRVPLFNPGEYMCYRMRQIHQEQVNISGWYMGSVRLRNTEAVLQCMFS